MLGLFKKKKEKKIHIIPCTNEWKGKGMNIYITLSIVRELCTRIPENMRKDPLKLPEEARKNVHREDSTSAQA